MGFDILRLTKIALDGLRAFGTDAGILGTDGDDNPRLGRLRLQTPLEDDAYPDSVELVDPRDLPLDATVASVGGVDAPTISVKRFAGGDEEMQSLRAIEKPPGGTVDMPIPGEIGGANSMAPLCVAAMTDLPVIDANGMGRTFPELQMDTFFIYGMPVNHAATTDGRDSQIVYRDIDSTRRLESLARAITVQTGSRSGYAFPLITDAFVSEYAVPHTVPFATELGRAVEHTRDAGTDPVNAGRELLGGEELFVGKIMDVYRHNHDGFALGSVTLAGLDEDATLEIEFQNEFLIAWDDDGDLQTTVPNLVCPVDIDTGAPVTADALRYDQRIRVLGMPVPEPLTMPEALDVIGPKAFEYEVLHDPLPRDETGW